MVTTVAALLVHAGSGLFLSLADGERPAPTQRQGEHVTCLSCKQVCYHDAWHSSVIVVFNHIHGWEIAVILRNFRKTKLSESKFLFFSFLFFFNSILTYIQCATRRLSLCDIRKYRFPAFDGTSDHQAAIFFCTRMIQTWSSFSLVDPRSIFFCFSVKPKFFTPTHAYSYQGHQPLRPK